LEYVFNIAEIRGNYEERRWDRDDALASGHPACWSRAAERSASQMGTDQWTCMETWRRVRENSSLWIRPGQTSADQEQLLIFTESIGPTYILFSLVVYGKPQELYKNILQYSQ
jgi:hypothetical protein